VEAERRGSKIKKRLAIDPVEAELVRRIFQLYVEGDGSLGPLGVKDVTKWLNAHGHRTRRGATFGVGPLHRILTNRCYATGKWPYGVRNSKTGALHDPTSVVEIEVPTIIPIELYERVRARLVQNNPRVTPPRVVNGPNLLTGLAVCASCGAGMTRTATRRRDRTYAYYSCAGCHQKGKTVCKGRHIPLSQLDELVVDNVKTRLLAPERLGSLLEALVERRALQDIRRSPSVVARWRPNARKSRTSWTGSTVRSKMASSSSTSTSRAGSGTSKTSGISRRRRLTASLNRREPGRASRPRGSKPCPP
jgi:hypothetical protein